MRLAVVPGSFDPITLGHVDLIRRAAVLFDRVIVAAMINIDKHYDFTAEERLAFLRDAVSDLPNVSVEYSEDMLYRYVAQKGACAVVKGIRNGKDTDYEIWMADYNRKHAPGCDAVLLPADPGLAEVSSSEVKRRSREGQDISTLVTPMVAAALAEQEKRSVHSWQEPPLKN